jgi:hypothetical protein
MLDKGSDVRNHLLRASKAHLVASPSEHLRDVDLRTKDANPKMGNVTLRPIEERQAEIDARNGPKSSNLAHLFTGSFRNSKFEP